MKTKFSQVSRTILLTVAVVLLAGIFEAVPAGQRGNVVRARDDTKQVRRDTGSDIAPRPVVDETPINPDSFNNRKRRPDPRVVDQPRKQPERKNVRRH